MAYEKIKETVISVLDEYSNMSPYDKKQFKKYLLQIGYGLNRINKIIIQSTCEHTPEEYKKSCLEYIWCPKCNKVLSEIKNNEH
jgi:hypothetical protein